MNILIWLVVGGIVGWLASWLMKADDPQGIVLNVVIGMAGAMVGGWFITPLIGFGTIRPGDFSPIAIAISLVGAALLIAIFNLFRPEAVR